MVPRTSVMVFSRWSAGRSGTTQIGHPRRCRGADKQGGTGEALGAHRGVLIADLAGFDEIAQRARYLVDRSGGGGLARAVAGHHQHRVEGARQPGAGGLPGLGEQGVAGQLQAAVQERVSSPLTIPLTVPRARLTSRCRPGP